MKKLSITMEDVRLQVFSLITLGRHFDPKWQAAQLLLHGWWGGNEGIRSCLRKDGLSYSLCQLNHEGSRKGASEWHEKDLGLQGESPWFPRHLHQGDKEERAAKIGFGFVRDYQGTPQELTDSSLRSQCHSVWEDKDCHINDDSGASRSDQDHRGHWWRWKHKRKQDCHDWTDGSTFEAGQRSANA